MAGTPPTAQTGAPVGGSTLDNERAGNTSAVLSGFVPLLLGVGCAAASLRLQLGSLSKPGPGLWPLLVSAGATVASAALMVVARSIEHPERFTRNTFWVLVGVLTLVGYTVLLPLIGFEIPLLALFVVWMKWLGKEGWRVTLLVAVAATAAFFLLFVAGLGLTIPHLIPWG